MADGPDGVDVPEEGAQRSAPEEPRTPVTQKLGRTLLVIAAGVFAIFAVVNAQHVDFNWVFGSTDVVKGADGDRISGGVPLIVLLLAAFVLGAVVAWLATLRAERRKRKRERSASERP